MQTARSNTPIAHTFKRHLATDMVEKKIKQIEKRIAELEYDRQVVNSSYAKQVLTREIRIQERTAHKLKMSVSSKLKESDT